MNVDFADFDADADNLLEKLGWNNFVQFKYTTGKSKNDFLNIFSSLNNLVPKDLCSKFT